MKWRATAAYFRWRGCWTSLTSKPLAKALGECGWGPTTRPRARRPAARRVGRFNPLNCRAASLLEGRPSGPLSTSSKIASNSSAGVRNDFGTSASRDAHAGIAEASPNYRHRAARPGDRPKAQVRPPRSAPRGRCAPSAARRLKPMPRAADEQMRFCNLSIFFAASVQVRLPTREAASSVVGAEHDGETPCRGIRRSSLSVRARGRCRSFQGIMLGCSRVGAP